LTSAISEHAKDLAHKVAGGGDSGVAEGAARSGLAARGVLYLLVALLAAKMALGSNEQSADKQGALRSLADSGVGKAVLVALVIGFGGYTLWRLYEAALGHRDERDDRKRTAKRVASLGKGAIYAAAAATAASTFLDEDKGSGDGNQQNKTLTAEVMSWPAGRLLVAVVGAVAMGAGCYLLYRGVTQKFERKLKTGEMPAWLRPVATVVGLAGYAARGLVVGLLGVLLIGAALHHDPNEAQGIDGTLRTIAEQPFGRALLLVAAAGLAAFGLYSFVEARYRRT